MTTDAPGFDHPLRARSDVPRSDLRRVIADLVVALDAVLAAHAPMASGDPAGGGDLATPQKQALVEQLTRCLGADPRVTEVAVGDMLLQLTCADEAAAAAVTAVLNHLGIGGKASWFKGDDDRPWIVVVVPTR